MRRSLFGRMGYGLTAAVVAALVLLAVSMSLLRVAVAYAPQFRGELEQVLAEVMGRPLTIGGMRAIWSGRHPRLILEDVRLTGAAPLSGLHVPELEIDLDLLRSLRDMRPQPARITVSGLDVQVHYLKDGRLQVARVGNAELPAGLFADGDGEGRLPAQLRLRDADVTVTDMADGSLIRLAPVNFTMDQRGEAFALAGYLPLPERLGHSLRFRAEWSGRPGRDDLDGQLYIDGSLLRLQAASDLLARLLPVPATRGSLTGELWADIEAGRLTQITGRVALDGVEVANNGKSQTVAGQLIGRFAWLRQPAGWVVAANELRYVSAFHVWPATDLVLRRGQRDGLDTLELRSDYLRVDDLATIAELLPMVPAEARRRLNALRPSGELLEPRVDVSWADGRLADLALHARFKGAGVEPEGRRPGAEGLAGEIWVDAAGGRVRLDAVDGRLHFGGLFRRPLPFERLQGELAWRRGEQGWELEAPSLSIANADARVHARLRVVADGRESSPLLDVRARLEDGDAASLSRYLPVAAMPAKVVQWLDGAIVGGRIEQADLVLFGRARGFPFGDGSGVFDVQAGLADLRLRYQEDWPALEQGRGRLRFAGRRMDIEVEQATIAGARVLNTHASIADLRGAPLVIEGHAQGSGDQLLGFLAASPLGRNIGDTLALMRLSGSHAVDLRTVVPLQGDQTVQVRGQLALNKGDFRIPRWELAVDDLQGTVRFDERGIEADGVAASFRGIPTTLTARTTDDRIRVAGRLQAAPQTLLGATDLPWLTGESGWDVELLLPAFKAEPAGGPAVELRATSALEGIALALPAPLGKPAAEPRPLRVAVGLREGGLDPVRLQYGDDLRAVLAMAPDGLKLARAGIALGGVEPVLPSEGVAVTGRLAELDLASWQALADGEPAAGDDVPLGLSELNLRIDRLLALGQVFADTEVQLRPASSGWAIALTGPDVAGRILLPGDRNSPIWARLQRLRLQPPDSRQPEESLSSSELPVVDVVVDDLRVDGQPLGHLTLVTRPNAAGIDIEHAEIDGPLLKLQAAGGWQRLPSRSTLFLAATGTDAGRLLDALGYRHALRDGALRASVDLSWNGHMLDFDPASASGSVELVMTDGQILKVDPGAGRLFGLLSVGELPRRLSLDFSDLFGKGFAYDRIEAHLRLTDGNAFTRKFYMQGPSARVELKGRIGLATRDYEQQVTITPNVSTTLPAIGAVAAGPIGAVAGFVTEKLLAKEINKLSRFSYRLEGSWDAPQIEPVGELPATAESGLPAQAVPQ